ncbi:ABC transporter permease [Streptomyces sp. NPDC051940]|uniref:ABC transporter permease n=1 Tax=Streptomyces sp. NPDC051940 TaxID=3155675 RepID=UPI003432A435
MVSRQLVNEGVRIGDTLTVDRLGIRLKVLGTTGRSPYGHVPAAYLTTDAWREIRFTAPGSPTPAGALPRQYTAMALKAPAPAGAGTLAAADRRHHTRTVTLQSALTAAPGYEGERLTMTSIQTFLFLIAPLVVGAFFAVWTVQRTPELALQRALGASRRRLLGHTLAQAALVVSAGTAAGAALASAIGLLVGEQVPFSLPAPTLMANMVAVALAGLAGAALTLRRVTTVDPMTMLGAAR